MKKISLKDAMQWAQDTRKPGWDDTLYHSKYTNQVVQRLQDEIATLKLRLSIALKVKGRENKSLCNHERPFCTDTPECSRREDGRP